MLQAIESWDFQGYGVMLGCLGLFGLFTILERRIGQLNALIIHECLRMFLMTFTHSLLCGRWIGRYFFHIKTQHLSSLACLFNPKTQYLFCLLSCFVFFIFFLYLLLVIKYIEVASSLWDSTPTYRFTSGL